jgi:hypothetical protein
LSLAYASMTIFMNVSPFVQWDEAGGCNGATCSGSC